MNAVTLTNIPRQDMAVESRSRHVYPFWDAQLAAKYGQLNLPHKDRKQEADKPNHPALRNTWFDVKVFHYGKGLGTLQRWPFSLTKIEQADGIPTDKGLLDPEDLGDVLSVAPSLDSPLPPRPSGTGASAHDAALVKKKITDTRCRQFPLKNVPEDLRKLLWKWYTDGMVPAKNEAIRIVNSVTNEKLLPHARRLYKGICPRKCAFAVSQGQAYMECPSQVKRSAVLEAVSSRQAILTRFEKSKKKPKIGAIVPDPRKGFVLTFAADMGAILFEEQNKAKLARSNSTADTSGIRSCSDDGCKEGFAVPRLRFAPRTLRLAGVQSPLLDIDVRGQPNRQWLFDICYSKERPKKSRAETQDEAQEDEDKDEDNTDNMHDDVGCGAIERMLPREFAIQLDKYGDYHLLVFYKVKTTKEKTTETLKGEPLIGAEDPGFRVGKTLGSANGTITEFGCEKANARLAALRARANGLHHQRTKKLVDEKAEEEKEKEKEKDEKNDEAAPFALSSKKRRQLRRKEMRTRKKHDNLVRDFHRRTANYMATTHDVLIKPRFEVHGMIKRGRSKLPSSVKEGLLGWAHCKGLDIQALKCHDVAHDARYDKTKPTVLLVQPEAYTSMTCAKCGHLNRKLGPSKIFKCPSPTCDYEADRDHNAAFNMIIKAMR